MIVCVCSGVSERHVEAAIAAGARTTEDVGRVCGAGRDCRACCPMLESLLERDLQLVCDGAVPSE
jgi:bacterioferritin-associated ferredoxin